MSDIENSNNERLWKKLQLLFPDIPLNCRKVVLTFEMDEFVRAEADFYPIVELGDNER